jgi:hypothetical protein
VECEYVNADRHNDRLFPMSQTTPMSPSRKLKAQRLDAIQLKQHGRSLYGHLDRLSTKEMQCGGGAATIVREYSKPYRTFALSHTTLLVNTDVLLEHLHAQTSRKK